MKHRYTMITSFLSQPVSCQRNDLGLILCCTLLFTDIIPSCSTSSSSHSNAAFLSSSSRTFLPKQQLSSNDNNNNFLHSHPSTDILPTTFPHRNEALIAIQSIQNACRIISSLQPDTSNQGQKGGGVSVSTITKQDTSPVTIADYAAQAMILKTLKRSFPDDLFIAEESSDTLQSSDPNLIRELMEVTNGCFDTEQELLNSIDVGQQQWHVTSKNERAWCLDPIDGTRGFLRGKKEGGQYCIALALIQDGVPILGILGCPNLPQDAKERDFRWKEEEMMEEGCLNGKNRGCLFVASQGGGCYQIPLFGDGKADSSLTKVQVTPGDGSVVPIEKARFCTGVETYGDPQNQSLAIAQILHNPTTTPTTTQPTNPPPKQNIITHSAKMDSQVKYAVLARGGAEVFLRIPKKDYVEWVWDHAAGCVVVTEAGGRVTDVDGNNIDFGLGGAKLSKDLVGIVATNGGEFHTEVLEAYRIQKEERERGE